MRMQNSDHTRNPNKGKIVKIDKILQYTSLMCTICIIQME